MDIYYGFFYLLALNLAIISTLPGGGARAAICRVGPFKLAIDGV